MERDQIRSQRCERRSIQSQRYEKKQFQSQRGSKREFQPKRDEQRQLQTQVRIFCKNKLKEFLSILTFLLRLSFIFFLDLPKRFSNTFLSKTPYYPVSLYKDNCSRIYGTPFTWKPFREVKKEDKVERKRIIIWISFVLRGGSWICGKSLNTT